MSIPAACHKLNDGQRAALDLSRDLIVTAGAGAGKTQVLGLRYLALLEAGLARVSEIVAFTFTEKAAAEMRERVQRLMLERMEELRSARDLATLERLTRAQREFHLNRISTVHSFCRKLLSEFSWEAGIEPGAPLLDARAQQLARDEAVRSVLLDTEDTELAPALARLGSTLRLGALRATLGELLSRRDVAAPALQCACDAWQDPQAEVARRQAAWLTEVEEATEGLVPLLKGLDWAGIAAVRAGDKLRERLLPLRPLLDDPARLPEVAVGVLGSGLNPLKFAEGSAANWRNAADLESTRSTLRDASQLAAAAADLLRCPVIVEHELRCGGVIRDLHAVFAKVLQAYNAERSSGLDFLDLELRAIELLRDQPDVRGEAVPRIRYLLIDEFQDTNPTQAELFSLLINEVNTPGRLFAVGDAKQSIYGFRGSDVAIFNGYLESVPARNAASRANQLPPKPAWGLTCDDSPRRRSGIVELNTNYRTVKPVLEAGNAFFDSIFKADEYRPFDARPQAMAVGRHDSAVASPVEFHWLKRRKRGDEIEQRRDDEAEHVAQIVAGMLAEEADGTKLQPSDFAILVRKSTRNDEYRDAFARYGIPLLVVGERGLFETQEALDCINLLRVLANPADDVAVLGLLRSPFASLPDTWLTAMGLQLGKKGTLLDRVAAFKETQPLEEASALLDTLRRLQDRAGRDAPALLLTEAISEFGYALAIGCGSDADQRLANVDRVIALVRETQARFPTAATLVRELRTRIENGEQEEQGVAEGEASGVRLMTIHKSKGLQFRIVIMPDLAGGTGGMNNGLVRDLPVDGGPLGVYVRRLDDEGRGKYLPDYAARRTGADVAERAASEEKRALYVAFTRAEDRVIGVGTVGEAFNGTSRAEQLLTAMKCQGWGHDGVPIRGVAMRWIDEVQRGHASPHTKAIAATHKAIAASALPLPVAIDTTLVPPIAVPLPPKFVNPAATEFGVLVHAGVERRLRGLDAGVADAKALAQVDRALDALATLPSAKAIRPEFELMSPEGARRLDLLRVLDDDRYEIIDFKTDRLGAAELASCGELRYGEKMREYRSLLGDYLKVRNLRAASVRLLLCFTGPDDLQPAQRLVEIAG